MKITKQTPPLQRTSTDVPRVSSTKVTLEMSDLDKITCRQLRLTPEKIQGYFPHASGVTDPAKYLGSERMNLGSRIILRSAGNLGERRLKIAIRDLEKEIQKAIQKQEKAGNKEKNKLEKEITKLRAGLEKKIQKLYPGLKIEQMSFFASEEEAITKPLPPQAKLETAFTKEQIKEINKTEKEIAKQLKEVLTAAHKVDKGTSHTSNHLLERRIIQAAERREAILKSVQGLYSRKSSTTEESSMPTRTTEGSPTYENIPFSYSSYRDPSSEEVQYSTLTFPAQVHQASTSVISSTPEVIYSDIKSGQ